MRVLLAIDGSEPAGRARDLVDRIEWPSETSIRVVAAMRSPERALPPADTGPAAEARKLEPSVIRRLHDTLDSAVVQLDRPGRRVERIILRGRAGSAIVQEARDFGADLVVLGNRGHGTISTMLLGSVSAEVVDHAPCPVLVARHDSLRSVVFATDGSEAARHAERVFLDWPILRGARVTVAAVADVGLPWVTGAVPGAYDGSLETYREAAEDEETRLQAVVDDTVARFRAAGHDVAGTVRTGEVTPELLQVATAAKADLIVIGSRGHTGLTRLLLGSVARNTVVHAATSVLVVREKSRIDATTTEPSREPAAVA